MPDTVNIKVKMFRYRKYLKSLTANVAICLDALDKEMRKPSSPERGKRIAGICNALNVANDMAWHFGLGESLKKKKYQSPRVLAFETPPSEFTWGFFLD